MGYTRPVREIIKRRRSWRSYDARKIEDEKRKAIENFMTTLDKPFWGNRARFEFVDVGPPGKGRMKGTYGMIKGAGTFIVGAISKGPGDMEDFGYLFEQVILMATDLDLATCWMGLTFARGPLAEKIGLAPGETIPAVSPLGYPSDRRSLVDTIARASVRATRRKPWEHLFFNNDWFTPLRMDAAGQYQEPLEMVRLGPSATNKQPWRIVVQDNMFHFFLQRAAGYSKLTGGGVDLQRIDMGIAMCHFELTARELGLSGVWIEKKPDIPTVSKEREYVVTWHAS